MGNFYALPIYAYFRCWDNTFNFCLGGSSIKGVMCLKAFPFISRDLNKFYAFSLLVLHFLDIIFEHHYHYIRHFFIEHSSSSCSSNTSFLNSSFGMPYMLLMAKHFSKSAGHFMASNTEKVISWSCTLRSTRLYAYQLMPYLWLRRVFL